MESRYGPIIGKDNASYWYDQTFSSEVGNVLAQFNYPGCSIVVPVCDYRCVVFSNADDVPEALRVFRKILVQSNP